MPFLSLFYQFIEHLPVYMGGLKILSYFLNTILLYIIIIIYVLLLFVYIYIIEI